MPDISEKVHFWRLQWVLFGEYQLCFEKASLAVS